jgi:hypothetical protein
MVLHPMLLVSLENSMNMGAPTWFENVWNYNVEVLFDY